MYSHRGFFFLESLSLIDCCVQECSFYFSYFNSKLDGRVISNGSSLQSRGVLLNDRHIPRERLTPCLLFLRIPLSRTLKKTNKTKQKRLFCRLFSLYIRVYSHKIPFQCFISINSNTDPNFTTTFVKGCFKCQKQFFFFKF